MDATGTAPNVDEEEYCCDAEYDSDYDPTDDEFDDYVSIGDGNTNLRGEDQTKQTSDPLEDTHPRGEDSKNGDEECLQIIDRLAIIHI